MTAASAQVDVRALKEALWSTLLRLQAQSATPDAGCSLQVLHHPNSTTLPA